MPTKIITPKARLLQLAKLVATDIRRGQSGSGMETVGLALSESPTAVSILLDLLLVEVGKRRPNDSLCEAMLFMIGQALVEARMAIEAEAPGPAAEVIDGLRTDLALAASAGRLPLEFLMVLAQQFAAAKLDLGADLRGIIGALSEEAAAQGPSMSPPDIAEHYAALAESLEHDPFLIHAQVSEQLAAFPNDQRAVIVDSFINSHVPAMRDAAVGWLLDPDASISRKVAQGLAAAAATGLVSGESVDRMVLMRPWLPEAVQANLDAAVRACRQRGAQPLSKPLAQINAVIASGCDGAGAQSFFVILKRGSKLVLASLLVKHGFGVRDGWVREGLARREVDEILSEICQELDPFDASPEIVLAAVSNGLSVNLERGEPPPFGLVQFLEAVGLTHVRPGRQEAASLIEQLLAEVPAEQRSPKALAAALAASKHWPKAFAFLQSWFEQDEAAYAAVASASGKRQQQEAVLRLTLPARRPRWAELLAWTAMAARDQIEGDAWIAFTLVANELRSDRLLAEIPVAVWIARNTATALSRR